METALHPTLLPALSTSIAPRSRWAGRALTGLTTAFLLFDSAIKLTAP